MQSQSYIIEKPINKSDLWRDKKPLLDHLDIELTERCNNNCIHCCINIPANDMDAKQKELSTEEVKKILLEAISLGCISVRFTGGEPLLREDFEELYIFARKSGLRVLIFTNATLITPYLAELFSKIPPLVKIGITVYGMKESSYEAVTRVPGSFKAFRNGVGLLLEKKVPFTVRGALLPQNIDEMDELENWASTIPWMEGSFSEYVMFFKLRSGRKDDIKNESIKGLRLKPEEGSRILSRGNDYVEGMKEFCHQFMRPLGDKLFLCGARCKGCVDAYGYFKLCLSLRDPACMHSLKKSSLKDGLINFLPKLYKIQAVNPEYLRRCARCFLKVFCEQCPANSWAEHGTLDTPVEYFCDITHAQARFLGLVREREKAWEVRQWKTRLGKFLKGGIYE